MYVVMNIFHQKNILELNTKHPRWNIVQDIVKRMA
jgi:hypothetical protein